MITLFCVTVLELRMLFCQFLIVWGVLIIHWTIQQLGSHHSIGRSYNGLVTHDVSPHLLHGKIHYLDLSAVHSVLDDEEFHFNVFRLFTTRHLSVLD